MSNERRVFELRLAWYQNLETGLVRSFLSPPKRGKWKWTALRHFSPTGRQAMAERRAPLTHRERE